MINQQLLYRQLINDQQIELNKIQSIFFNRTNQINKKKLFIIILSILFTIMKLIQRQTLQKSYLLIIVLVLSFFSVYSQIVANITMNPQSQIIPASELLGAVELSYLKNDTNSNLRILNFDKQTQKVHDFNKTYNGKILILGKSSNQDCILAIRIVYGDSANNSIVGNSISTPFTQSIQLQASSTSSNGTLNSSIIETTNSSNSSNSGNYSNQTFDNASLNNTNILNNNDTINNQTNVNNTNNKTSNQGGNQTYFINTTNQIFLIHVNFQTQQIHEIYNIPQEYFLSNTTKVVVGSQCQAYSIDNIVYMYSSQKKEYAKVPLNIQPVAFDKTLTYMIGNNSLYAFNTTSNTYNNAAKLNQLTDAFIYSNGQKVIVHATKKMGNQTSLSVYPFLLQNNKYISKGNFTQSLITDSFYQPAISPDLNYYFLSATLMNYSQIIIGKRITYADKNSTIDVILPVQLAPFLTGGYFSVLLTDVFLVLSETFTKQLNKYMFYFVLNQNIAQLINIELIPKTSKDLTQFIKTKNYQNLVYFTFEQVSTQSIISKISFTQSNILNRINTKKSKYYLTSLYYPRSFYLDYIALNNTSILKVYFNDLTTGVQKNMSLEVPGNWNFLAGANETMTCVMAYQNSLSMAVIARNNFQTAQINQFTNITSLYVQSNPKNTSIFHTASDCKFFSIDKNIFVFNSTTLAYQKVTIPSNWNPVQFDESFLYGIGQDGNLAVYNTSTKSYNVVNVQGLSKVLLDTYNNTKYLQIFAYQNKILLYTKYNQRPTNLSVHLITKSNNTYTLQRSNIFKRPIQKYSDSLISFTLDLNRVLILGNDLSNSKGSGGGFYFDDSGNIKNINISPELPTFLLNNPLDIETTKTHAYVRTLLKNSSDTSPQFEAFYKYQGPNMIKIGQRPLTRQNSIAWQKTIIVQSNSTSTINQIVYVDQFNFNGIVSLYMENFKKQFLVPNTIDTIVLTPGSNVLSPPQSLKWLSSYHDSSLDLTSIEGYQFIQNLTDYKKSKILKISELYQSQYIILGGTQQSQDCVAILIPDLMTVNLYQLVSSNNGTLNTVKLFRTVTQYFVMYYLLTGKNITSAPPRVDVAQGCSGFTIDNLIFRYNSTTKAFVNSTLPNEFVWRSLDQSFNFVEGSTPNSSSIILTYKSNNNSYYQMNINTTNQVSFQNGTLQTIGSLNIINSWTYYKTSAPNVLLVQYDSSNSKTVAVFKIITGSSNSSLSLIQLLSIQNKKARLFKSEHLTKIILGVKNSNGYTALIRSYNYSSTSGNSISKQILIPSQIQNITTDMYFSLSETHLYANNFMNDNSSSIKLEFYYKFVNSSTQLLLKDQMILFSGQTYTKALIANVNPTQTVQLVIFSEMRYQNTIFISWYQVPTLSYQQKLNNINSGVLLNGGSIYLCGSNCLSCNSKSTCINCENGFYLTQSQFCYACIFGCANCQNSVNCTTCMQGFFLQTVNNTCSLCNSSCLSCTGSSSNCSSCNVGQFLNVSTYKCENCSKNCISCKSTTNCTKCRPGFTVKNQQCVQCLPGCSECDPVVRTTCLNCIQGYYLSSSICNKCSSNCIACTSASICTACASKYNLTNSICIEDCVYPCLTCSKSITCLSCFGGYLFNQTSKSCQPDLSCNQNLSCLGCPSSYILFQDNSCQICDLIANCTTCSEQNTSICVNCLNGFYLYAGICKKCPTSCISCESDVLCTTCSDGFYLSSQIGGSCKVCTSPCFTCNQTSDSCLSCDKNYTLKGFKCIKNDRAQFQIRLGGNLTGFFDNMDQFKSEIMKKINRTDISAFTYTSIISGSVVTQGSVASSSGETSIITSSALQSAVTSGSTIGGYSVQSATFTSTTSNNSSEDTSSSSNVGLIIGIIIAIIILVIIIIFVAYYFKKKKQKREAGENSSRTSKRKRKSKQQKNSDSLQSDQSNQSNSKNKFKQKNQLQMQKVKYPYKAPKNAISTNIISAPKNTNIIKSGNNDSPLYHDQEQIQNDLISDYVQSAEELNKYQPNRPYL